MAASNLRVALMLCLNLFSSLSIVFVNKVNYLREQSLVKDLLDPLRNRKMLWEFFYFEKNYYNIILVVILLFKISIDNIDIDQFHWDINRSLSLSCRRFLQKKICCGP